MTGAPETCDADYFEQGRCVLAAGYLDGAGWGGHVHQAANGFRWIHHEELLGHDEDGDEVWDDWDEPIEAGR